jgi:hypothetical protein
MAASSVTFTPTHEIELLATGIFAVAVIHTFIAKKFQDKAHHYEPGSMGYHTYHFLGEVECVFGLWSAVFITILSVMKGVGQSIAYLESLNFTEPMFVFVIMAMAGTRPVIKLAEKIIVGISRLLPFGRKRAFYVSALIVGPLLGSFITEPAAMTVTAIILLNNFYTGEMSKKFKYATLGLLFVNISIGGTLSHFAAPPVLMVAGKWGWGFGHMIGYFGYKAAIAVIFSTLVISQLYAKELAGDFKLNTGDESMPEPLFWKYIVHVLFLGLVVYTAHHMVFFVGLFIFFLGFTTITERYQSQIKIKESLLVGFFLAGLVVLGGLQAWWLKPILGSLGNLPMFLGSTALTAITDNAALTYLGSFVELSDEAKYFLVAGAVSGGGLTVIANAPNPAGFGILKDSFGKDGISPLGLLVSSLFPTVVALVCFYVFGNL